MVLNNVCLLNSDEAVSINITGEKIVAVANVLNSSDDAFQLHFDKALAFPGLINSHDHLDFNCFPQMGNRVYESYIEWGNTILQTYKTEIIEVLKIPEPLRIEWGIYKNLLAGVTTVVNHGKYLQINKPLINVLQKTQNLHSVEFEKYWKLKLNNPLKKNKPCVIHAGEGTTVNANNEIDELIKYNFLNRKLIAIHGVAMSEEQAAKFEALVWCPQSNDFLLKKTARVAGLKQRTQVCFGTDSTLTSNWNIWDHLRKARELGLVNDTELFEMVTSIPASIWNLDSGIIENKMDADIVVTLANNSFNSFYSVNPESILMVIQRGNIRLFDESLYPQLKEINFAFRDFFKIEINGAYKYVQGNLPKLIKDIKSFNSRAIFPINTPALFSSYTKG
ncbi:MAG: hypothetical protein JWN83_30 [Chitinophagaceae bacterium]|nr:hypothetical protein [Chitinophagaceae bacterium]